MPAGPSEAPQWAEYLNFVALKKRGNLPDPTMPERPESKPVTIVSVFPRTAFNKVYMFGAYQIDPCPPCPDHGRAPCERCKNYSTLTVDCAREAIDDPFGSDGSRRRLNWISARSVAESLVQEGCLDRGVFIAQGSEPTDEELTKAHEDFRKWAEAAVASADEQWSRKRDAAYINPLARDAAKFLAAKREWLSETESLLDCQACSERVRRGTIVCGKCGYPVEWQKAYEMGLISERQEAYGKKNGLIVEPQVDEFDSEPTPEVAAEPVKRGPGRPKKVQ